jgi:hypothetical protein
MTKIILGYLQSGEKVYDRTPSHIHESAKLKEESQTALNYVTDC